MRALVPLMLVRAGAFAAVPPAPGPATPLPGAEVYRRTLAAVGGSTPLTGARAPAGCSTAAGAG